MIAKMIKTVVIVCCFCCLSLFVVLVELYVKHAAYALALGAVVDFREHPAFGTVNTPQKLMRGRMFN
jgi:uncharacterized membrane protein